ncbi:MAG: hypothetical protein ACAF42_13715 [Limnothrix sp. BL-A-16]
MARSSLPALTLALSRCLPIVLLSSQAIAVLAQTPRQGANGSDLEQPTNRPDFNPDPSAAEAVFPDIPRSGPDRPQIRPIQAAPNPTGSIPPQQPQPNRPPARPWLNPPTPTPPPCRFCNRDNRDNPFPTGPNP